LRFLARRVDCIEIDSTFLQIPRPELARFWAAAVASNPDFRFTARLHRDFTHERNLAQDRVNEFRSALLPLLESGRLGCLLMQMPASFRFTSENRDFLIRLRRAFHEFPLVAELRHASWSVDEAVGALTDFHVGMCNLDQPIGAGAMAPASRLTSPIGYFKLHGRRAAPGHFDFDDRGRAEAAEPDLYTMASLEEWRSRIAHVRRFAREVYVVFANSGAGGSVVNALQMESLLETRGMESKPALPLFQPDTGHVRAA
jgi:uncharacterized protein YecE (DUF72 family)